MTLSVAVALLTLTSSADVARNPAILMKPAVLNIGHVCSWQPRCMKKQEQSMQRALKYVRKYRPPAWKIQLCNRNASRRRSRVDWIGFDNCIRNPSLRPPATRKRRR